MTISSLSRSSYLSRIMVAQLKLEIDEKIYLEYKFHKTRKWRFDLALIDSKIAIEIHGGSWINGRHNRGTGFKKDREKMNEAQALGWDVYEFLTEDVENGKAAEAAIRYYKTKQALSSHVGYKPYDSS